RLYRLMATLKKVITSEAYNNNVGKETVNREPETENEARVKIGSEKKSIETRTRLWHERYAHFNYAGLKKLEKSADVYGVELDGEPDIKCSPCERAKSTRASFKEMEHIRSERPLELLHMDVWGPSADPTIGGAKYFLSITDDFTRYVHVRPMKNKNEVFTHFKNFDAEMRAKYGDSIGTVRTDNGG